MRTALTRRLALGATTAGLGLAGWSALAQTPAPGTPPAPLPNSIIEANASRPVAYIYGNIPVTRQELGEFLIARGGYEKLDLLVNKKIIETECQKKGVTVSEAEMQAALLEDVAGLSIKKEDFIRVILPRYGKTYFEWMEDVIRPKLLLTKLCRERVVVSEADLRKQFEREFGEKRKIQIIMWAQNTDLKKLTEIWGKLREDQDEFDRQARTQENVALASSGGNIKPISRHLPGSEKIVEDTAFKLQLGETSSLLSTTQGYVVIKLHQIIPADDKVKLEDVKPRLEKQAMDERISEEIPKYFAELKAAAAANQFKIAPTMWQDVPSVEAAKGKENTMQGVIPAGAKQTQPAGTK